jgi:hypothetical protein
MIENGNEQSHIGWDDEVSARDPRWEQRTPDTYDCDIIPTEISVVDQVSNAREHASPFDFIPAEADPTHGRYIGIDEDDGGDTFVMSESDASHIDSLLCEIRDAKTYQAENTPTKEDEEYLKRIRDSTRAFGQHIGIPLEQRFPQKKDTHVYHTLPDLPLQDGSHGYYEIGEGIYVVRSLPEAWPHEVAHVLAALGCVLKTREDGSPGLHIENMFTQTLGTGADGPKEWINDLLACRIQEEMGLEPRLYRQPLHAIGKAILLRTAIHFDETGKNAERMLLRGYTDGRYAQHAVDTIAAAIGPEAMRLFANMDRNLSMSDARTMAAEMGLPHAAVLLDKCKPGVSSHLLKWYD